MTSFFSVHLVLTVVSLTLGTVIGVLGVRALRRSVGAWTSTTVEASATAEPRA